MNVCMLDWIKIFLRPTLSTRAIPIRVPKTCREQQYNSEFSHDFFTWCIYRVSASCCSRHCLCSMACRPCASLDGRNLQIVGGLPELPQQPDWLRGLLFCLESSVPSLGRGRAKRIQLHTAAFQGLACPRNDATSTAGWSMKQHIRTLPFQQLSPPLNLTCVDARELQAERLVSVQALAMQRTCHLAQAIMAS